MPWQDVAAKQRSFVHQSIPAIWRVDTPSHAGSVMSYAEHCDILTPQELAITEMPATGLVRDIAQGNLSSVTVTTAFCKRAAVAHQLVNCLHGFYPEMAIARAKYLDDHLARTGKPVGPMHGLPISLKDQFRIRGLETMMGYVGWIGRVDTENSVLVELLLKAGAVLYVKTSVPQTLMICETINNVIGRTTNPRNGNWSCGGSSGGEGALLSLHGSVLGVGTDLGGSIRVPAAFNALYGLRPSHGRLPYAKAANSMEGQEAIHSVCGPLAHSVADLRLFVTSILAARPWCFDSKVIAIPWRLDEETSVRTKIRNGGLTLGYYTCDGNVRPHPPIRRAVEAIIRKAEAAGHTTMPWKPYKHSFAVDLAAKIYGIDGGADCSAALKLSGEPPIPNVAKYLRHSSPKSTINESWDLQAKKWKYQCEYLAKIREFEAEIGRELDAIVAPATASAAIRHDRFEYYGFATVVSLLDYTSVVVPVTLADQVIDTKVGDSTPLTEMDGMVQEEYDPAAYHGAPVAIQVIGQRLTEEKVLCIAEELGKLLS